MRINLLWRTALVCFCLGTSIGGFIAAYLPGYFVASILINMGILLFLIINSVIYATNKGHFRGH